MDKDVVDPDGGVNLAKKRKILGVAEVVDPEINENFPSSGFQCGTGEFLFTIFTSLAQAIQFLMELQTNQF